MREAAEVTGVTAVWMPRSLRFAVQSLLLAFFWVAPTNAGDSMSYDIVWQLEQTNPDAQIAPTTKFLDLLPKTIYETRLVPDRLYQADEAITSKEGILLIEKETQLVGMDFSSPLVCSLTAGGLKTLSSTSRVCLLDENNDGTYDSYFTKPLGNNLITYSGKWYAMKGKIPKKRQELYNKVSNISKIKNSDFSSNILFSLSNAQISKSNDKLTMDGSFNGEALLKYRCVLSKGHKSVDLGNECSPPGFDIRYLEDVNKRRYVSVKKLEQVSKIKIKYSVSLVGIVGGITSILIY